MGSKVIVSLYISGVKGHSISTSVGVKFIRPLNTMSNQRSYDQCIDYVLIYGWVKGHSISVHQWGQSS